MNHRWCRRSYVSLELGYIRMCITRSGSGCFCRRYETNAGTIKGYLPLKRSIRTGMLKSVPRCGRLTK